MKRLINILLAITFVFGVVGCGNDTKSASTDIPKIIVGLDDKFPPMGFRDDNGDLAGFDLDMARAAGEKMGAEMVFQPIDWSSKELELRSGRVDLLWNGYTITDERKELVQFTKPYLSNKQIIMVNNDSGISNKADLSGQIIGLQRESSALDAVKRDSETANSLKEIVEYDDNIFAFKDLEIGRTVAVVVDEVVAKYYLSKNDTNFTLLEENFGDEEYGVGTRQDDTDLYENLQKALDEMNADGTSAKISEKWFGEDKVLK